MDAFARCWVQELALLRAVQAALDGTAREAMARLCEAWLQMREDTFERAMGVLARSLARTANARQPIESTRGLTDAVKRLVGRVGPVFGAATNSSDPVEQARATLAARLDDDVRASTAELLALHGLEGRAQGEILARVAAQFDVRERVHEGKAAVLGGLLSGALAGLKADLLSGGLTMGGGLLAGGLLGALGGAGLARGINVMRGGGPPWVGWSAEAMGPMVDAALLRYLAVAHFGRGRGQWSEGEAPAHWREVVAAALVPHREPLRSVWRSRGQQSEPSSDEESRVATTLQPLMRAAARESLERLYAGTWRDGAPPHLRRWAWRR